MKIFLGSLNPDKIKIAKDALEELKLKVEVSAITVDPEIAAQPLDKETTKKGAINRAKNTKKLKPDADFWLGLEGGLHDYGEGYHLVTYACLVSKDGEEFMGEGEEIHLPLEVSEKIQKGEWFGKAIREYAKDHTIDNDLITRLSPFTRAVQSAYVAYLKVHGNLGYRKRSSAIIVDADENYLIVQLQNYNEDDWNFSGGGIEEGETPEQAVLRELGEELGTTKFEILKRSKNKEHYDWPNWLIANDLKKKPRIYRGQEVTYFLVKFIGERADIKPDPEEIKNIKWVKYNDLKDHLNFVNQWKFAKRTIKELLGS